MIDCIKKHNVVLDTSDGGAGKTWMTAFAAKALGMRLTVVCPKPVIATWEDVCARVGVGLDLAINPELLLNSKWRMTDHVEGEPLPIGYWSRRKRKRKKGKPHAGTWTWFIRRGSLLVFDEAHRFGGYSSQNAKLVAASRPFPTVLLSATIADSPIKLRAVGYRLGICEFEWFAWVGWLQTVGVRFGTFGEMVWPANASMETVSAQLAPYRTGINTARIPGFPQNRVYASVIKGGPSANAAYERALKLLKEGAETAAVEALRARQIAELEKTAWAVEEAERIQAEGKSVFIATCFTETAKTIARELKTHAITGDSDDPARAIAAFQSNEITALVGTQGVLAEGISLHDLHGRQRESIVFPNFNSLQFVQALKRIHRAGGVSPCLQRVPFLTNTIESRMRTRVEGKLNNLSEITDNDFSLT